MGAAATGITRANAAAVLKAFKLIILGSIKGVMRFAGSTSGEEGGSRRPRQIYLQVARADLDAA